jgi:hypothetical protein
LEIGRFLSQVPQILARLANPNFSAIELIANTHANERQESGKLRYLESVNSQPYDPEVLFGHGCEIFSKARHCDCVGQCAANFC